MQLRSPAGASASTLIFAFLAGPAFANVIACASGNLSTVDNTTCDIGNLQFTFTGLSSTPINPWTDSDFIFTVLSNGFELSGPPAQTITATTGFTAGNPAYDNAQLDFSVTDLTGAITSLAVSGGNPSVSGPSPNPGDSFAKNELDLCNLGCSAQELAMNLLSDASGNIENGLGSYSAYGGPIVSGSGHAIPFDLFAADGYSAGIDSTTTSFTFTTGPAPPPPPPSVPEPRLIILLSISVLGLLSAAKHKRRHE